MRVSVLIENTKIDESWQSEHGLSLHIQLDDRAILFDCGQSNQFIDNAKRMGIELADVDALVISHGHYDHGGGIKAFLSTNHRAKVYLKSQAFSQLISRSEDKKDRYIGLDQSLKDNPRLVYTDNLKSIGVGVEFLYDIKNTSDRPMMNEPLYIKADMGQYLRDDFRHEQHLVVMNQHQYHLFVGCSHGGLINILSNFYDRYGFYPDVVYGGFHLGKDGKGLVESEDRLKELGQFMKKTGSHYYTGHCTSHLGFMALKEYVGNKIELIHTGMVIEL
jgi:7,8-dihydropterin-6-yl-methyl-4-(beta-D-ribofuranosyl)aminobenzene 5'-phosphate synthase